MTNHTPEPWSEDTHARSWRETGGTITAVLRSIDDSDYARAAACVNALAGVEEPDLVRVVIETARNYRRAANSGDPQVAARWLRNWALAAALLEEPT